MASFLEFHSATYGAPALKTTDSNWVNYVFENEAGWFNIVKASVSGG